MPIVVALFAGCATDAGDEREATLYGYDAKTDSLVGKTYSWSSVFLHDWVPYTAARQQVTVRLRAADKLALRTSQLSISQYGAWREGSRCTHDLQCNANEGCLGQSCMLRNYGPADILAVGLAPITKNVELQMMLFTDWRDEPVTCDGRNLFSSLDLDLRRFEITIDRVQTYRFDECGIDVGELSTDARNHGFRFSTVTVPFATTDGKNFAGTYEYENTVEIVH
jgi:hypothetical protein